jgi:deazaflavin-dependent oxidoreductase (nitroreductase family)
MPDWDPRTFTANLIADLRAHGGTASSGPMAGRPLLILTTTGAKTGQQRETIVTYTRDGDDFVVAGSKSGAPTHPSWFVNLVANPIVHVEAAGRSFDAKATETEGADRDRLWDAHAEARPEFKDYPGKTGGRIIPMVRLTPIG